MKFFLFADFHHAPGYFRGGSLETLRFFQKRAEEENCDFMIHLGDFTNCRDIHLEVINAYNEFHIPSYHVLGNHDADNAPFERVLEYYRMPNDYYCFDVGGYRIIATNPNNCYNGEEYYHYSMGNYLKRGGERDWIPPEQIAWLKETIDNSPYPCILLSHESFERSDGVKNRAEVVKIIDEANKRRPHSVLACFNGHHHRDYSAIRENVLYQEINAVYFDWIEKTHDLYPEDMCNELKLLSHTVGYTDPLYCIVTVEGMSIRIEGSESTMWLDVDRAKAGCQIYDSNGRAVVPKISNLNITL